MGVAVTHRPAVQKAASRSSDLCCARAAHRSIHCTAPGSDLLAPDEGVLVAQVVGAAEVVEQGGAASAGRGVGLKVKLKHPGMARTPVRGGTTVDGEDDALRGAIEVSGANKRS